MNCPVCNDKKQHSPLTIVKDEYGEEWYYCITWDHRFRKATLDAWFKRCEQVVYYNLDGEAIE